MFTKFFEHARFRHDIQGTNVPKYMQVISYTVRRQGDYHILLLDITVD